MSAADTKSMNITLCYPVSPKNIAHIKEAANEVGIRANVVDAGQDGIADALMEADIFCGHAKVPVDWPAVVSAGRLQWIQSSAAGMDHCLVPAVIESEIPVTSASGLFAAQVAEQTMAMLLGSLRSMPVFYGAQKAKEFVRRSTQDLKGKTIGIIGLGGNGRRIAEVLCPFQVSIIATDLFPVDKPDCVDQLWPADKLDQLLKTADIVILAIPLNSDTRHYMGADEFTKMRSGAMLVNVARGSVVDELAMVEALRSGQLGAAALDVVETEPLPAISPLWDMANVIITPHVGAQSADRVDLTTRFFCENLRRFVRGQALMNTVDRTLGFPKPEKRFRQEEFSI